MGTVLVSLPTCSLISPRVPQYALSVCFGGAVLFVSGLIVELVRSREVADPADLPPMSLGRSTPRQVARMLEHWRVRSLPTDFD